MLGVLEGGVMRRDDKTLNSCHDLIFLGGKLIPSLNVSQGPRHPPKKSLQPYSLGGGDFRATPLFYLYFYANAPNHTNPLRKRVEIKPRELK